MGYYNRVTPVMGSIPAAWEGQEDPLQVRPTADRVKVIKINWTAAGGNTWAVKDGLPVYDGQTLAIIEIPNDLMINTYLIPKKPKSIKIKCTAGQVYYTRDGQVSTTSDYLLADRAAEYSIAFTEGTYYRFMGIVNSTAFIYLMY